MDMIEKPLLRLPNLRLIGRGGSSDGTTWVKIELGEPLPILKILKQMLPVKEAVAYGNNIVISLNARQAVYDN